MLPVKEKILELLADDGDRRLSFADWTALRTALIGRPNSLPPPAVPGRPSRMMDTVRRVLIGPANFEPLVLKKVSLYFDRFKKFKCFERSRIFKLVAVEAEWCNQG